VVWDRSALISGSIAALADVVAIWGLCADSAFHPSPFFKSAFGFFGNGGVSPLGAIRLSLLIVGALTSFIDPYGRDS
jgi:hypothetical protein